MMKDNVDNYGQAVSVIVADAAWLGVIGLLGSVAIHPMADVSWWRIAMGIYAIRAVVKEVSNVVPKSVKGEIRG